MKVIIINWGGKNKFLSLKWWLNFPQSFNDKTECFDSLWRFSNELITLIPCLRMIKCIKWPLEWGSSLVI